MAPTPRFLQLADVAEILNTSSAQVYALVRRGDLPAIKIGGRGQWRVEVAQLEDYIQRMYDEADTFVAKHPFVEARTGRDDEPADEEP
jgi:excisionase family DNA binding protein